MRRAIYLAFVLGFAFVVGGCPSDDDGPRAFGEYLYDDDTTAGDDDTGDADTDDDDDTVGECAGAVHCEGSYDIVLEDDLEAIELCGSITGDLEFYYDILGWLTSIDLPCLETVGVDMTGYLEIGDNPTLTRIDLSALRNVAGDLTFYSNDALTSFGLPALTSTNNTLYITFNDALTSFDLPALMTVDGTLWIASNDVLTSFDAPALTTVGGNLEIRDNPTLTSLDGLSSLVSVGARVFILRNDCLSEDEVEAFVAGLTVGVDVTVGENGANYPCN